MCPRLRWTEALSNNLRKLHNYEISAIWKEASHIIKNIHLRAYFGNQTTRVTKQNLVPGVVVISSFFFHGHNQQIGNTNRCLLIAHLN